MSGNNTLEMLRNPRPYPHGTNGKPSQRPKQPNRAFDELRKPQPYPSASQPTQRPPSQPQTGRQPPQQSAPQPRPPQNTNLTDLRNPRPYPSAAQTQPYPSPSQPTQRPPSHPPQGRQHVPQQRPAQNAPFTDLRNPRPYPSAANQVPNRPKTPESTDRPTTPRSNAPPSASQPAQADAPQKNKPRVAVSSGAPKPYQPPRQATQHVTPPVRTIPPSASQPRPYYQPAPQQSPPQYENHRTPTTSQATTPRGTTPQSVSPTPSPRSTMPRGATTPVATTPRATTPIQTSPRVERQSPPPQHSSDESPSRYHYEQEYDKLHHQEPPPIYKNPRPESIGRRTPTGDDYSDYQSGWGEDRPSPESDVEFGAGYDGKTSAYPEKKITDEFEVRNSESKHRLTSPKKSSDRRKVYGQGPCRGLCMWIILAIIFIVILALALALGLALSNRGVDYSGQFAINLGKECNLQCSDPSKYGYTRGAVLMIALDGFRPEYMGQAYQNIIPNIHRLAECGSLATNMEPSYPSTTYPNLYTLVTGLYPTVHGIVADYFRKAGIAGNFDPRKDPRSPLLSNKDWYNGKPIWQTAKEQGIVTGSHSWIGNEVGEHSVDGFIVNPNPDYTVHHNPDIHYLARIQSALNWFKQSNNKAKFVNIYFEEPGNTIMKHGVKATKQIENALAVVDDAIGLFLENLERDSSTGCFDIVLVSTSGHLDVNCNNRTFFEDVLPSTLFYNSSTNQLNSMAFFTPTADSPSDSDTADELVKKLGCGNTRFESYTRDTVPPKYHFYNRERQEAAMVIMDDWHTYASTRTGYDSNMCVGARGGYSPSNSEMKGILLGFGPSFRQNYTKTDAFSNVEVYNLISELIDITPEKNNGTKGVLNDLLKSDSQRSPNEPLKYFTEENSKCTYPTNNEPARRTLDQTECNVPCSDRNVYDMHLDKSSGVADNLVREKHAPLGAPVLVMGIGTLGMHHCRLVQGNYMTVFENKLSIPLYVAYSVETATFSAAQSCVRYDIRLQPEVSPKCSDYKSATRLPVDLEMGYLCPTSQARNTEEVYNTLITSNIVPMWKDFKLGIWSPLSGQIKNMANGGGDVNVVAGPAFDTDRDGVRDLYTNIALMSDAWAGRTPVPTHYFLVITRCKQSTQNIALCDLKDLEVEAYIFPHTNGKLTCDETIEAYMRTYQASVLDVEKITGLSFFSELRNSQIENDLKILTILKMSREPFSN